MDIIIFFNFMNHFYFKSTKRKQINCCSTIIIQNHSFWVVLSTVGLNCTVIQTLQVYLYVELILL